MDFTGGITISGGITVIPASGGGGSGNKAIFGYGDDNKEPYLARLGWITTANDMEKGLELLSKWLFSTEPPKKNDSLSPVVERVPLAVVKQRGGKVLSAA